MTPENIILIMLYSSSIIRQTLSHFVFVIGGKGGCNFMKPDFFPCLQVLQDYSEWAINCARIFFKIKHMTWITKEIAQFFSMASLARVFFSGKIHWNKFYQTFVSSVITSDAWNFRRFLFLRRFVCPKLKSFENVWPVRKQAIIWQFISMAMEITVKQKYST